MTNSFRNTRHCPPRSGMVIVAIIALLAVASMLFGVGAKSVLQEHRQIGQREHSIQSRRMAEAGLARAVVQLAVNEEYEGEVWEITAEQLGGKHVGRVTIRLPAADSESPRRIIATAEFPSEGIYRSTTTLTQVVAAAQDNSDETETGDENGTQ